MCCNLCNLYVSPFPSLYYPPLLLTFPSSKVINEMEVCVKYLDTNPLKSSKAHPGDLDIPVTFGGVTFTPGEYVYGDEDGVVISPTRLSL